MNKPTLSKIVHTPAESDIFPALLKCHVRIRLDAPPEFIDILFSRAVVKYVDKDLATKRSLEWDIMNKLGSEFWCVEVNYQHVECGFAI